MAKLVNDEPQAAHIAALETHFGHSSFRPMQWSIIRSIIEERRDNCVIMATGYGKSLTYQFPSVFLQRLTVVISPLISLMEDQVLSLNLSNIPACLLGSAQRANLVPDIIAGKFRVVYLTPEYVTGECGRYLLEQTADQLVLIAIDEAHCLSKWGHDFRPAYRNLGVIRKICPRVPILAVTATATPNVREDIVRSLGLRNAQVLCTGFDRPNLQFHVKMKSTLGVWEDVRGLLSRNSEGSIIIYCLTRKQTEEIVDILKSKKIQCEPYHAGLTLKQRKDVHESFVRDRIQIIVATIAFGMGIDKPDVRLVIHYGASKDLESYYQEAGRAGRDGQPSKCFMFWGRGDFKTHEILREHNAGGVQKNLEALSKVMHEYLDTRDCRRKFILKYFEGDNVKIEPRKNCCDNCDRTVSGVKDCDRYEGIDEAGNYDFSKDTEQLLKAIGALGGGTGLGLPIALLRGSKTKKLSDHYHKNPLFGIGKGRDEEWWKSLAGLLEREGFLQKTKVPNHFNKFAVIFKIQATTLAKKWLETPNRKMLMKPSTEMFKSLRLIRAQPLYDTTSDFQTQPSKTLPQLLQIPGVSSTTTTIGSGNASRHLEPTPAQKQDLVQELAKCLLKKRSELATTYECMPYMIASNQALLQMATIRPLNLEEMKRAKLDGFSDIKIQKFGKEFLTAIQQKLKFLPGGAGDQSDGLTQAQSMLQKQPYTKGKFSPTHQTTWNLWQEGRSVADISKFRSLTEQTVASHLCEAIKHGFPFGWKDFGRLKIDRKLYDHVKSNLPPSSEGIKLTEIKNFCWPHVTFEQIKLIMCHHYVRKHLEALGVPLKDEAGEEVAQKVEPPAPALVPPKKEVPQSDDLWGDEDDDDLSMAESSFVEIDRICEEATASGSGSSTKQKENQSPVKQNESVIILDDDDDDEGFDLDEIAALEQAVIGGDGGDRSPQEVPPSPKEEKVVKVHPQKRVKSRGILYEDEEEETNTHPGQGPSPVKQAKVVEPSSTSAEEGGAVKNIFRFKTASASGAPTIGTKTSSKRIMYDDEDDSNEDEGFGARALPRRKI